MTEHELTPSGYAQAVVARCVMFGYRDGTKAECQLLLIKVLSNWRTARYVTDEDKRELLEKGFDIGERPHTSCVCFDDQNIRFHYYMRGSKPILVYPFRKETIEKSVGEDVKRLEQEDWRKLTKPLAFRIRHHRTRTICAKRIIFNLDEKWYNVIKSGKPEPETGEPKLIEYRKVCKHWASRLGFRFAIIHADNKEIKLAPVASNYNFYILDGMIAVFRVGYPSDFKPRKWPDIVRRIVKIDIGPCPYDGWDGEYFRIHFEEGK